MISAARVTSFTILDAASRASSYRVSRAKPAQAGIGVGDGRGNRLIHFVGQRGSQLSHGGHPADVCEIRLRLAQSLTLFLRLLALDGDAGKMRDLLDDVVFLSVGERGSRYRSRRSPAPCLPTRGSALTSTPGARGPTPDRGNSDHSGSVAMLDTITGSPRYAAVPHEPTDGPMTMPSMASM